MSARTKKAVIDAIHQKFSIKNNLVALDDVNTPDLRMHTSVRVSQDHNELTEYAREKGFAEFICPEFMPNGKWAAIVRHKVVARCNNGLPLSSKLRVDTHPFDKANGATRHKVIVNELEVAPRIRLAGQALTCIGIFVLYDIVQTNSTLFINTYTNSKTSDLKAVFDGPLKVQYSNQFSVEIPSIKHPSTFQVAQKQCEE